ncbi:hypothetical protein HYALB_00011040 [Hymenoscyphus albidus]|uniref:Uncharacterized protein n=1 Tax=Hymenoscyphus albidus TaxID=595503 RepID=A0A9N9LW80_9HELO|nr:hypothetical protein HYALB_00011040 [Hymenoscyphus albidus]
MEVDVTLKEEVVVSGSVKLEVISIDEAGLVMSEEVIVSLTTSSMKVMVGSSEELESSVDEVGVGSEEAE